MTYVAYKVPVRCSCGFRSQRAIGPRTDDHCPRCDGTVEVGYFVQRGDKFVRAWRTADHRSRASTR